MSIRIIKLYKDILSGKRELFGNLVNKKNTRSIYNVPFPCTINDDVEYNNDDSSYEDFSSNEDNKEENFSDQDETYKKKIKSNLDEIPELLEDDFNKLNMDNNDEGFVEIKKKRK